MTGTLAPAITCHDVTVKFGDFVALSDVNLSFERGLVHAVVGQNGAGKTTLARVAAGLIRPDSGRISIDGKPLALGNVRESRKAGVELVHQSFALPPSFAIAEAMEFGADRFGPAFSSRGLRKRWSAHLKSFGIAADLSARIRDLPIETQQSVEIARALVNDASILILDEPTAVLSPSGVEALFERVRGLKKNGITVILVLHKIREVLAIADTVSVLRGGRLIAAAVPAASLTPMDLADQIVGSETGVTDADDAAALVGAAPSRHAGMRAEARSAVPVLALSKVATAPDVDGPALADVTLRVHPGEIVGVAGVEGNGQKTLVRAIAGLTAARAGAIELTGLDVTGTDLGTRRRLGLSIIPFERNSEGLSLTSSLWENWSVKRLLADPLLTFIRPAALRSDSDEAMKRWDVRYRHAGQPAGSLSGGNAQKLVFSREVDDEARLVIAAQPTRGLDVGATAFVWQALRAARDRGAGVLLISSDLDELFDISDRLIVMLSGRIVADVVPPFSLAAVGAAMTGAGA
ncbi:MAG: ATP-binding cassette domain-containing protein [Ancalomicrobiaceae bacterium]|nr:ATP-binding cassette domain-containing protein [Ancalomicrobiaceae bacterium]